MSDKKKSSEWELFQARQRQEHRDANPRSWGWLKVLAVLVAGAAVGCVAYLLL